MCIIINSEKPKTFVWCVDLKFTDVIVVVAVAAAACQNNILCVCVCEFAQSEIIVVGEIVYNNHNRCSVCSHTHTHRDIYQSVYEYFCRSQRRRFFRFCPIVSVLSLSTVVPFMSCTPCLSECTQECIHM